MNCASTRTVEVFITFFAGFAALEDDEAAAAVAATTAAGVTTGEVEELLRGVAWPEAVGVESMSLL
jgi:hypothetical protein